MTDSHPHEHHDHVVAPLRDVLRQRLIQPGTMRVDLRVILGFAIAQLIAAAVLVGLKDAHGGIFDPSVYAFPSSEGQGIELVSAAVFAGSVAIMCAAWAFVLAGAFRAGVVVRLVVLAIFGWSLFIERDALSGLPSSTTVTVCVLLAVIAVAGAASWFPEHRRHSLTGDAPRGRWEGVRWLMIPLLFLLIGGIYLTVYLASHSYDVANPAESLDQSQLATFSNDVFDQVDNIQYLLIPVLVLAGADFGEWGNLAISRLTRRIRRTVPAWTLALGTLVGATLIGLDGARIASGPDGGGLIKELTLGVLVCAFAATLAVLAKPTGGWTASLPFFAIAVAAVLDTASGFIVQLLQAHSDHLYDYIQLASAGLWVVCGIVAVAVLAIRRGKMSSGWNAGLIFIALVGIVDLLGSVWTLGNFDNAPLGITSDNAPFLGPEGLRMAVACVTAILAVAAVAMRRARRWAVPIALLLSTLLSLELLSYLDLLYANKGKLEGLAAPGGFAVGGAIILIAALLWDLTVSGEAITNGDSARFPRGTRVGMFMGYILLVAAAVVMFNSIHSESGKLLESSFDPEQWVQQGILFLGIPLVLTLCAVRLRVWRSANAQPLIGPTRT